MNKKRIVMPLVCDIILGLGALLALIPFVFMVLNSLREVMNLTDTNFKLSQFTLQNYITIFKNIPMARYIFNSTVVVVFSVALVLLISSLAGYGFSKKKFKGRNAMFALCVMTMMVPGQVISISVFNIFHSLHLLNTYAALILPNVGAFGIFLMKQFMDGVPDELIEAAHIDGCSELQLYARIVVPILKPVIVSLTIFTFIGVWNDFIWPLIIVNDSSMNTLTLGLSVLKGNYKTNYGLVMAGATITFFIPFALYCILQKHFVEGIALSGIKG